MRNAKKLTALVLAGLMTTTAVLPQAANAATFTDVPDNHWAAEVIDYVSDNDLMVGYGQGIFAPNKALTQAEFIASMFNIALKNNSVTTELDDQDDANAWYDTAVWWAKTINLIDKDTTDADLKKTISREEAGSILYQYISNYNGSTLYLPNDTDPGFTDAADFKNETNKNKIAVLYNNALVSGKENMRFDPQGTLTRAEAAALAARVDSFLSTDSAITNSLNSRVKARLEESSIDLSKDAVQFVSLLNDEREKEGKDSLKVSPLLTKAAQLRAKEVVERCAELPSDQWKTAPSKYFHTRPNGKGGTTAIQDFMSEKNIVVYSRMDPTENLVRSRSANGMTPTSAFDSLMGSEGHKTNMMNKQHEYVGVGYYSDGQYSAWVQLFANAK